MIRPTKHIFGLEPSSPTSSLPHFFPNKTPLLPPWIALLPSYDAILYVHFPLRLSLQYLFHSSLDSQLKHICATHTFIEKQGSLPFSTVSIGHHPLRKMRFSITTPILALTAARCMPYPSSTLSSSARIDKSQQASSPCQPCPPLGSISGTTLSAWLTITAPFAPGRSCATPARMEVTRNVQHPSCVPFRSSLSSTFS